MASEEEAILAVVRENLRALNTEEIDAVMATINPNSPGYTRTRQALEDSSLRLDLEYVLEQLEFVSVSDGEAVVSFVQTTTRRAGAEFRDNRITGWHVLRLINGRWFLNDTFSNDIEYLDEADGT